MKHDVHFPADTCLMCWLFKRGRRSELFLSQGLIYHLSRPLARFSSHWMKTMLNTAGSDWTSCARVFQKPLGQNALFLPRTGKHRHFVLPLVPLLQWGTCSGSRVLSLLPYYFCPIYWRNPLIAPQVCTVCTVCPPPPSVSRRRW